MAPDTDTRWHLDREILTSRAGEDGLVLFELHAVAAGFEGVSEAFVAKAYALAAKSEQARPASGITMLGTARRMAKGKGFLNADRNTRLGGCDYS